MSATTMKNLMPKKKYMERA